jgi:peptidyl-prolyl cis-trans isomerase C
MNRKTLFLLTPIWLLICGSLGLAACQNDTANQTPTASNPGITTPEVIATFTDDPFITPTTDPGIPLAASINGQGLTLEEYQAELLRAQAVSGTGLATYDEEDVLQNLIDEVLLAQGAAQAGFTPDEDLVQTRIAQLGLGEQALQDWLLANSYSPESFQQALSRSIAATWMRDQIIATVPSTTEQVHARQILLYNSDEAENVYTQLQAGSNFAALAADYDPLALGDLGWFPRGYLTVPDLDEPVFALQPGEYTPVIETALGFHIVQVIERDSQHPLSPGAFQATQVQAVQNWLVDRHNQSDIQILLP